MGREMEDQQLTPWRRSTRSGNGGNSCVEVATVDQVIALRDSKDPDGPRLRFSPAAWNTFTAGIKRSAH
jgi:hypothetical protein